MELGQHPYTQCDSSIIDNGVTCVLTVSRIMLGWPRRAAARQAAEVALPSATGTRGGCLLLRRVKACRAARSLEEKSDGVYWDRDLKPKCG